MSHNDHNPSDSNTEYVRYWQERAREQGKHCVVHCSHSQEDADREAAILANHFGVALAGMKKRKCFPVDGYGMDFGCGWGRWTRFLSDCTGLHMTGVDVAPAHIEKADPSTKTAFTLREDPMSEIPFEDKSLNFIFTCTVLQHIVRPDILEHTIREFERVLKDDGTMLIFEATENIPPKSHIHFRTVDDYQHLFPWLKMQEGWSYIIRGEKHSLMLGERK